MNDRTLAVLEKYDLEVLRSWKGRGAILCETKTGVKILKEYKGNQERLLVQQQLLKEIKKNGSFRIRSFYFNEDQMLLSSTYSSRTALGSAAALGAAGAGSSLTGLSR